MAKTAERSDERDRPSPKDVGRHLREVRKQQGLSRGVVARSAGLTRRELAAYERGRVEVPESDLWCLAGSCGVEVSELLPRRDQLQLSPDLASLTVGDTIRHLREPAQPDGMLRQYLSMIYELRNLPPGSRVPLRQPDLAALADALGGTPESIEGRLQALIGASPDEAARLRAMILPPASLPSAAPAPASPHTPGDPYAALTNDGDVPPAVEQFFAAPGPVDPFAAPGSSAPPPPPIAFTAPDAAMPPPPMPAAAPPPFATPPTTEPAPPDPTMAPAAFAPPSAAPMPPPPPVFGAPPPSTPLPPSAGPAVAPPTAAPVSPPVEPSAPFAPAMSAPPPTEMSAPFAPPMSAPAPSPAAPSSPFAPPAPAAPDEPISQPTPAVAPPPPSTPFPPAADVGPMAPAPDPALLEARRAPSPPASNGTTPAPGPLVAGTGSDPFLGPVDAQATAAAPLRDPFAARSAIDPMAPPPLPPDPFAVPAAATAAPNGSDGPAVAEEAPPVATDTGVVIDDPFAPPEQSVPDGSTGDAGLGITVLDAIVVDDPMAAPPAPPPADDVAMPPIDAVEVLAPGSTEPPPAPPVEAPEAITWNAAAGTAPAPPAEPAPSRGPRFERASTQWQIGGIFPATAMADDGTLALRRADTRWALTDLSAPGDSIVEAAFDFRAGSGFGLIFRGSVDQGERITGYSFDVDPIAGGGGYLVRLWEGSKQHWRPLAQAAVTDPALLYGRHVVRLTLRADQLTVLVDGDPVLEIPALSRCTVELGREPARGDRVGVQAWSTTEVTVESFRVANL